MSVCIRHVGFLCLEFVFLLQFCLSFVCVCVWVRTLCTLHRRSDVRVSFRVRIVRVFSID